MGIKPKILLVGLEVHGTARLPQALQAAGFRVGIVSRPGSFLGRTRFRDEYFQLGPKRHGAGILAALRRVIAVWQPDVLLPMDDATALYLARCWQKDRATGREKTLAGLLEKSLGNPAALLEATDKWQTWLMAQKLGRRVPASELVRGPADLSKWIRRAGGPVILRSCFSLGGIGVRRIVEPSGAPKILAELQNQSSWWSRMWHAREVFRGRQFSRDWLPVSRDVMASECISGRPAMLQAVAHNGKILGSLQAVAEATYPGEFSPASVVHFIRHEEMLRTAQALVAHWQLGGFVAFDFMLDASNQAWLLECNPRPIPISHLGRMVGEDLCARYFAQLTGSAPLIEEPKPELVVAHFPKEQRRDANSSWLTRAFHDVPVDDPDLVAALLAESLPVLNPTNQ